MSKSHYPDTFSTIQSVREEILEVFPAYFGLKHILGQHDQLKSNVSSEYLITFPLSPPSLQYFPLLNSANR